MWNISKNKDHDPLYTLLFSSFCSLFIRFSISFFSTSSASFPLFLFYLDFWLLFLMTCNYTFQNVVKYLVNSGRFGHSGGSSPLCLWFKYHFKWFNNFKQYFHINTLMAFWTTRTFQIIYHLDTISNALIIWTISLHNDI